MPLDTLYRSDEVTLVVTVFPMWEYFNEKSILVTGGSGFLGTALVYRLLTSTSTARIYLVCRGGGKYVLCKAKTRQ